MIDFSQLLSKPMDEIKAPVPLPNGTYHATVLSYEEVESKQKKTPGITIKFGNFQPIEVFGDLPDNLSEKEMTDDFWISEAALFRLKEFIGNCGISTEDRSLGEGLSEIAGQTVLLEIQHEPSNKPGDERTFARIKRYAPA